MAIKNDGTSSLAHTRWDCRHRIAFAPKYRRKAIYAKLRSDIGKHVRRLCEHKGVGTVEARANLKYNYGSRHFWSEGHYVSAAGLNKTTVQNCIRNQELEDQVEDRKCLKEYKDPFTGG